MQRAPDLSYSGLKYNEAFVYDYLKSPKKIRNHIGKSRMPDFGLADNEALALTKYLMSQKTLPGNKNLESKRIKPTKTICDYPSQIFDIIMMMFI